MNILILTPGYPDKDNLYNYMFVHARAEVYSKKHRVLIVTYRQAETDHEYEFGGIRVVQGSEDFLFSKIKTFQPDVMALHVPKGRGITLARRFEEVFGIRTVTWVHLEEAINWWRRYFDFDTVKKKFRFLFKTQFGQMFRLMKLRVFFQERNEKDYPVVFVSHWLHKVVKTDCFISVKQPKIIPNPINTDKFPFSAKTEYHQKRILLIRSFSTRKYANDIAVNLINKLLAKDPEFYIEVYGKGKYFDVLMSQIADKERVSIHNSFLKHEEMSEKMKDFGFFLTPTRQDSHGVTMCEAMSCGLIPIVNKNSAIPENVENLHSGVVFNKEEEAVENIIRIAGHEELFQSMSHQAARHVQQKLSSEIIVAKELKLLEENMR